MSRANLVEKTEKALLQYLTSSKGGPGSPFPTEKELVDQLGVSRTVVREALNRLKVMGVIDSRTSRGSVVASPDLLELIEKVLLPQIMDQKVLKNIFELRLVLEVGMADLIFMRVTRTDIMDLRSIVAKEGDANATSIFDPEHEISFHRKLYELTGNDTLKRLQSLLLPSFKYVYDNDIIQDTPEDAKFKSHSDLIDELEGGTAESFRNAMREHLDKHYRRLFDQ